MPSNGRQRVFVLASNEQIRVEGTNSKLTKMGQIVTGSMTDQFLLLSMEKQIHQPFELVLGEKQRCSVTERYEESMIIMLQDQNSHVNYIDDRHNSFVFISFKDDEEEQTVVSICGDQANLGSWNYNSLPTTIKLSRGLTFVSFEYIGSIPGHIHYELVAPSGYLYETFLGFYNSEYECLIDLPKDKRKPLPIESPADNVFVCTWGEHEYQSLSTVIPKRPDSTTAHGRVPRSQTVSEEKMDGPTTRTVKGSRSQQTSSGKKFAGKAHKSLVFSSEILPIKEHELSSERAIALQGVDMLLPGQRISEEITLEEVSSAPSLSSTSSSVSSETIIDVHIDRSEEANNEENVQPLSQSSSASLLATSSPKYEQLLSHTSIEPDRESNVKHSNLLEPLLGEPVDLSSASYTLTTELSMHQQPSVDQSHPVEGTLDPASVSLCVQSFQITDEDILTPETVASTATPQTSAHIIFTASESVIDSHSTSRSVIDEDELTRQQEMQRK